MPYLICSYHACQQHFYLRPSRMHGTDVHYHSPECRFLALKEQIAQRTQKTCRLCKDPKPLDHFHISLARADGHQDICKACISTRDKTDRRVRGLKLPAHPHLAIDPNTGRFISVIPLIERFWSYVDQSGGPEACWPWTGALDDHGYGTFSIRRPEDIPTGLPPHTNSDAYLAPRIAYVLLIGPIPDGLDILHSCDNPPCVNAYKHLFPGTQLDNMQDMKSKGRHIYGERNGNAKLTDVERLQITMLKGYYSSLTVASWYNVSSSAVLHIWKNA